MSGKKTEQNKSNEWTQKNGRKKNQSLPEKSRVEVCLSH